MRTVISGTGLYTPRESVSNEDLAEAFNTYVRRHNEANRAEIEHGTAQALKESSAAFIESASGIRSRYVMNRSGIVDPERLCPSLPERSNDEPSLQCEMAVTAARQALEESGAAPADIGAVIVACSNMQRPYPAIAIEVQQALGISGYAFDMNVACSSATFGLQTARDAIVSGSAERVLVVNPEICTGHLNFRDRDSHFIFGDACTAMVVERMPEQGAKGGFEILGTRLRTVFSNNIRNNYGFLNRCDPAGVGRPDKLFVQNGRKVFKEVVPMVAEQICDHLASLSLRPDQLKRLWLHQANLNMNVLIARKVLGRDAEPHEAPVILDRYANTSSAGSIIAFHEHKTDLRPGDLGVICSFGAGYSVGSVLVRRAG